MDAGGRIVLGLAYAGKSLKNEAGGRERYQVKYLAARSWDAQIGSTLIEYDSGRADYRRLGLKTGEQRRIEMTCRVPPPSGGAYFNLITNKISRPRSAGN